MLTFLLLTYGLLWLPPVQKKVKDMVLKEMMKKIPTRIDIEDIYFHPFNHLQLKNVYVGDLHGDTLLYVGKLSAGFDLFQLPKNDLAIHSVDLEKVVINIQKDSLKADFNFQFLIDAFASEQSTKASDSKMTVRIRSIALREGRIRYDILSEPALPDSLWDYNHICLTHFRSNIDLNVWDAKNWNIQMKHLSFAEKSGWTVKNFQTRLISKDDRFILENLHVRLPNSQFNIPQACYTLGASPAESFSGNLEAVLTGSIHLPDFKMLHPALAHFPEKLSLSAEINGILPQIHIRQFQADYGKRIHLECSASMNNYKRWQDTPLHLELNRLSTDADGVKDILGLLLKKPVQALPIKPGAFAISGLLKGSSSNLSLHLTAAGDRGKIQLEATGGYNGVSKETYFDAWLQVPQMDVKTLLQDSLYGLAGLQLQTQGKIDASGQLNINGNASIDRFDFKNYSYNRMAVNAMYQGDTLRLKVDSSDNNFPLKISACADIGGKSPGVELDANLECIALDALHLLPDFKSAFLTGRIHAAVNGFKPENMQVDLSVDSLSLITDKGIFNEPHFDLVYKATDNHNKQLQISSHILNVQAEGNFTYTGLLETLHATFPMLFPNRKANPENQDLFAETLNFRLGIKQLASVSKLLDLPQTVPDSVLLTGKYNHDGKDMQFSASAYTRFSESDTLQLSLSLTNKANNLAVIFNVDNKSANYDFDGSIEADVEFVPSRENRTPDLNIELHPTVWVLNETDLNFNPARIEVRGKRYHIGDLSIAYAGNPDEYVKVSGFISAASSDSLALDVSQCRLSTFFGAVKTDIPLSGVINGRLTARNLFSTPLILSRNFAVDQIAYDRQAIGDLKIASVWSSQHNGLSLYAVLNRENRPSSTLKGFFLPEKDSVALQVNIRDIELEWMQEMMKESLYGLAGSIGADITVSGKITDPEVRGMIRFDNAQIGINALQTLYLINDSIYIYPDAIELKKFTVLDENKHTLSANGKIKHHRFSAFHPNISLSLNDFLVINNIRKPDGLFYGNLRINGLLNVKENAKNWLISGDITHSDHTQVTVNIPSAASTAERYTMLSYIHTENEESRNPKERKKREERFTFPLKINASLWFDPSLTIGVVFNRATGDAAFATGSGKINLDYDMRTSSIGLWGDYTMSSGSVGVSLANIAKKTFTVQQGGILTFQGDPKETRFSLTALYNLRADLKTLDPSFRNIISNAKSQVSCSLTATGSINKMALEYDIQFPNEPDDIQRKVDALLYTDDMKIKEIAYLMAFDAFLPASNNAPALGNPMLMNSLSALTSGGLNALLAGVLHENWTIGTNFQTGDRGLDNMAINVSGTLLDDRLTINGTVGYHNNPVRTNNFTGDFDIEYKLLPSGNVVLKIYNITNNQYYEQAPMTQGVGLVYKREARTFRKLFDKFKKKKKGS